MCGSDVFLGILAIFFPPIAVWVKRGICSADSLINIALCCLAYLPGLLHAWYIISVSPDPTYDELAQHDPERGGNITYYYVQTQPASRGPAAPGGPQGYGTVNNVPNAQFPGQQQGFVKPPKGQRTVAAPVAPAAAGQSSQAGAGEEMPPPSYANAVAGDHKIQGP
ncbi:unnamed protein product [Zymoseptoria tritici ST99CH_1E4]|uniref:Stress response RCI peptide n=1 Tax=Zymoseptoria tritici ST99CH_1E4 TaxID=1276532 RepID=A0A2H1GY07_ZYMTR|nr:unnamed protein product [Zymoseptoria tritici ST99CH_1E4]